ncbi:MAG: sialate O-acetylesterase [Mariniblastus sp.]
MKNSSLVVFAALIVASVTAHGQQPGLSLSGMFGDHMVLQRNSDAPIWGAAKPNEQVSVGASWTKSIFSAVADENGKWQTKIKTRNAGGPFKITVKSGEDSIELNDVLLGEVWICSGQSNMQWKMRGFGVDHFKEDVAKAKYPNIRFCAVPQVLALNGQDDVKAKWNSCNPKSVLAFSAVGYFFGSRLHQELDVPIGLISTNWGGSSAEAWVSPDVLAEKFPEFKTKSDDYERIVKEVGAVFTQRQKDKPKGLNQRSPSVLYNSMIRPVLPYSIRGVIWYQGESNCEFPEQYRSLFPTMIQDWRTKWGIGDFPFYYVQIAPFKYKDIPGRAAFLREAQMMALSEPNTGMAVTMDIGEANDIHPKKKKPVGERLALLALARDYGKTNIVDSGPLYKSCKIEKDKMRLEFSSVGGGLVARDGKPLSHFTMAGPDKKFVLATAIIDGETVVVSSDEVSEPVAVRYGFGNADMPNLSNKEGLPASSFRTDDWEMSTPESN